MVLVALILAASGFLGPGALWAAGSPGDFANNLATHPYAEALEKAQSENKLTLIYFWTPSCPWCRAFSETVLTDPDVKNTLVESFVVVSVNADRERKLARRYRLPSVPYLVFLDSSGEMVSVLTEAVAANFFLVYLEYLRTGAYATLDFRDFVQSLI